MLTSFMIYAVVGAIAGVLAGLLGIGGGLVIVPMLVFSFTLQHIPQELMMHLALGTSLASIIFTSVSSFRAHHKRGAVRWDVFKRITPGIIVGTLAGSCVASTLPTHILKGIFVAFLYYVATQMILGKKPAASRQLPRTAGIFGAGGVIGSFSSLVGIGGGTLSVPFLTWCNIPVHHAIGTSSAIGLPIALAGAFGYILNGLGTPDLPDLSLGFVYLPALFGTICFSVLTAPVGAKLAHSLPVDKLKRIFAILLYVVATRMLISVF
ncbi:sulfite exporter TauE/SafE family protein [Desulfoluna butyratoxydans]|uniref:Probable membrane transporter protein n=1 Tax=Desulfoluna butyratoxydans TaxID=231438 RepID=A0A4U8YR71_9BACT|nr:sulfite exporter TauE/SafE family protein [Desulfoluna butyratoxydans]VFQ43753.1 transmembrane protein taue-like [Desulfoluna butyratoxydans]